MFDRVWRNLHEYANANRQAVMAKFIMLERNSNIEEIAAFIAQCRTAGIGRVRLSKDTQTPATQHILEMSATLIFLAMKEELESDFLPFVFGKANCMWMMHYVHKLVAKEKGAVDHSRLWKLNHMVFNYLRMCYPINT